jgi:hypothetical protein
VAVAFFAGPGSGSMISAFFLVALAVWAGPAVASGNDDRSVDVQIAIAADVSISMDREEKFMQAAGFAAAFRDPEVIDAITDGPAGRIAVAYFEWGGARAQRLVVPWTVVDGIESAWRFAEEIERARPGRLPRGTSIAGALARAQDLLDTSGIAAGRRVVNLSGDGPDDRTLDLQSVRQKLLDSGATINAMAVVYKSLLDGVVDGVEETMTPADMLAYFQENVIGGAGAFVEPVWSIADYATAIKRKLLREIRSPSLSASLMRSADGNSSMAEEGWLTPP